ncbi:hypothetical protein [Actinosynnema sp. NPDC023926]
MSERSITGLVTAVALSGLVAPAARARTRGTGDERVPVDALQFGVRVLDRFLRNS